VYRAARARAVPGARAEALELQTVPHVEPTGPNHDAGSRGAGVERSPLAWFGLVAALAVVAVVGGTAVLLRGPAVLRDGDTLGLLGLIALGGLAVLSLAAGRLRKVFGVALAVDSALRAYASGRRESAWLTLPDGLGRRGEAWNTILAERDAAAERRTLERLASEASAPAQSGPSGSGTGGDLSGVCDVLWQGLVLLDEQLRVRYVNGAAAVFLGQRRESVTGKPAAELGLDARVLDAVRQAVAGTLRSRAVIETGSPQPGAGGGPALADAGGNRRGAGWTGGVLRFSVRPVRREDRGSAMVMIEDITQQRVADEARNAFVAQATHELRTPLTNIRLYVEQLVDDPSLPALERGRALNVISQEARRLERIVGDMLSVSEIEAGTLRIDQGEIRLASVLEEMRADFQAQAVAKQVSLAWDISPKLPVLRGDRDKLTLAVHNLLGNALKYTPAGGKVSVRADVTSGQAVLEFTDSGIGIDPSEHQLIFERFYRAKDQRLKDITGSGLGLALAREVVRMHGGDITVHSAINQGSTFTITLPLSEVERKAAA
jgi:signal transduction histidine kinase